DYYCQLWSRESNHVLF
nr:immunoglobulin light chain junction region [Macaca mulatta]MOW17943.1 immunoglobulin light chain junction region [Macaca mulatta]